MQSRAFWLRRALAGSALCAILASALAAQPAHLAVPTSPATPRELFKDLFIAVQSGKIFPDSKAFADAVPKESPQQILALYHAAEPLSAPALKEFVEAHFSMPAALPALPAPPAASERAPIARHIDELWDKLTRLTPAPPRDSSLLATPEAYVVPGGRFRELYYWDSYFTMLGLLESGRRDLIEHMVRDFSSLIDRYGHVPNGTRSYYLSRSQPPFFYAMVGLVNADDPAAAYARYLPQLRREYAFWMQGEALLKPGTAHRRLVALPDGAHLNRYWDDADTPREESYLEDLELARRSGRDANEVYRNVRAAAESGWDFSTRWFADGARMETIDTIEVLPVDLNSLLFGMEEAIRMGCERAAKQGCVREFTRRAAARRAALDRYSWDEAAGVYRDYGWVKRARLAGLSAATLYPLFTGAASAAQARAVARTAARDLLKGGGIVTTPHQSGQQWDAPNGWAPLQWIAVSGMRRYAIEPLAAAIACRWMAVVNRVYAQSGKLVEKYDVIATGREGGGGEYPTQDGFGWTNGVMRKLMALYPADAGRSTPQECPALADAQTAP